ncbi:MAG: sensor histidine kinase [Acidobacteria bacterium]|nr:MAG: sensor histidine kinase [Acidobacteriota bacterium]
MQPSGRSPTTPLYIGLVITLLAVVGYSWYVTGRIASLRELQTNLIDRNRKDSLQLLRIQNELNSIGISMRDMLDADPKSSHQAYPLTAWRPQFARMRVDLEDAFQRERRFSPAGRTSGQQQYLQSSLIQFWAALDDVFSLAQNGKESAAREQVRSSLQSQVAALSNFVARLLVQNNESEEHAAAQVTEIYDHVQRQAYVFLIGTLVAIVLTSLYLIRSNRLFFNQLAALSAQRSELAQTLISAQESTLRYISRELHDEFGQILTAMGAMLGRARNLSPENSQLRADLMEVREIAQSALDKVRSLSQALHPVMLDEAGLEQTIEWYLPTVERQTGVGISYEKSGTPFPVSSNSAVHIYRLLQEALNNLSRHSGAKKAWVRLHFAADELELEIEDRGVGFAAQQAKRGLGLVAMRERAELLAGSLTFETPAGGGTIVRLRIPKESVIREAQEMHA